MMKRFAPNDTFRWYSCDIGPQKRLVCVKLKFRDRITLYFNYKLISRDTNFLEFRVPESYRKRKLAIAYQITRVCDREYLCCGHRVFIVCLFLCVCDLNCRDSKETRQRDDRSALVDENGFQNQKRRLNCSVRLGSSNRRVFQRNSMVRR